MKRTDPPSRVPGQPATSAVPVASPKSTAPTVSKSASKPTATAPSAVPMALRTPEKPAAKKPTANATPKPASAVAKVKSHTPVAPAAPALLATPAADVAAEIVDTPAAAYPAAALSAADTAAVPPPAVAAANPPAAVSATPPVKDIPMTDTTATIENTAKATTDKAQAMFAQASDQTKGVMEKGTKMVEEMNVFTKGNVEAMVESTKIAVKGMETLAQDAADYARTSLEGLTQTVRTMSTVKSPTELMKLQSDFMRQSFDAMVAQTAKSTEAMMKLAGEVAQPVSNRVATAADKMKPAV